MHRVCIGNAKPRYTKPMRLFGKLKTGSFAYLRSNNFDTFFQLINTSNKDLDFIMNRKNWKSYNNLLLFSHYLHWAVYLKLTSKTLPVGCWSQTNWNKYMYHVSLKDKIFTSLSVYLSQDIYLSQFQKRLSSY